MEGIIFSGLSVTLKAAFIVELGRHHPGFLDLKLQPFYVLLYQKKGANKIPLPILYAIRFGQSQANGSY